jgi:hypothetical protein
MFAVIINDPNLKENKPYEKSLRDLCRYLRNECL